jgi:hypothetical protein
MNKPVHLRRAAGTSSHSASLREGLPFPLGATWDGLGVN